MRKAILILSCLCLGLLTILGFKIWNRLQIEVLHVEPPKLTFRAARQFFPYSVIPGGVLDPKELADSMAKDHVVREHYRGVKPDSMWFTRTKKPMNAYVSYRKGEQIGWTSHPVLIAANELVLTDGKNVIRARCGNRIEVRKPEPLPAKVVPPEVPPPDIAMDTGLPALIPPTITPPVPPDGQIAKNNAPPPPGKISTPPTTWCCGLGKSPLLPSVPEPSSIILVCSGILALVVICGRKLS